ncbi:TPA: hypothetical protein IAC10_01950 [Candidatus Scatousia excrementigallinarum]|uniref:Uncharacterized protein n=1 Tax=Candidatus Scatousia excrementigallinarum TaxID=2840935 RepID=A0A9D1EXS8_9BACT|nr:hypothetical protein [Candidatus Scatousia excrementigallinarum]
MFEAVRHTTYIQNNFFGNRNFNTPCIGGNNFYNGSLFGFGFGCAPALPQLPVCGFPSFNFMPSFPVMGGCCSPWGGFGMFNWGMLNRTIDMFSLLNTFNATTNLTKNFFNTFSTLTASNSAARSVAAVRNATINTSTNLPGINEAGYNAEKGGALAKTVANRAVGFTGYCAKSVREALDATGLGTGERGDGYEYARILSHNPNFKEVSTGNLNLSDLPAGCVLVYDRGVAGYSNKSGHVEVTLGNGQAVSDGVTNNIKNGARVFIPV